MIYAVSFIILLGILVFVHEFGHFIFAKLLGVKVEVFSLGFGKAIIKKRVGETVYQIAMVPLGGFVKLYGQDPSDEIDPTLTLLSFRHQKLFKRFLIVFAGPMFNIILSIILFAIIYMVGNPSISTKVADVRYGSTAYEAGIRDGDLIKSVDGKAVKDWDEFSRLIKESDKDFVSLKVNDLEINVKLEKLLATNKFGKEVKVKQIDGLSPFSVSTLVGVTNTSSIASSLGFKTGDLILEINNEKINKWSQFEEKLLSLKGSQIKVKIKRLDSELELFINGRKFPYVENKKDYKTNEIDLLDTNYSLANELGFFPAELFVSGFTKVLSPAKDVGLAEGDRIVALNNTLIRRHKQLQNIVNEFGLSSSEINITVERGGKLITYKLKPEVMNVDAHNIGLKNDRFLLGIQTYYLPGPVDKIEIVESNFFKAVWLSLVKTFQWIWITLLGFWKLITGGVSLKALGGPLMLGKVAGDSMSLGIVYFLKVVSIISINLGLINLFPIPILDGGHIMFYGIELVTRKPLKEKYINYAQQFGFYILIGLMVLAFYNDILRYSDFIVRLFK